MHKQPIYCTGAEVREVSGVQMVQEGPKVAVYTNGIEEVLFKVGFCLPAGPYVTDDDVKYIVQSIKEAIA